MSQVGVLLGFALGVVTNAVAMRSYLLRVVTLESFQLAQKVPPLTQWIICEEMRVHLGGRCADCGTRTWVHVFTCAWWKKFNEMVDRTKERVRP